MFSPTAKRLRTDTLEDQTISTSTDGVPDRSSDHRQFPLPTELILAVIAHVSADASAGWRYEIGDDNEGQPQGRDTLMALSQTCRVLRNVCLPILWETVSVGLKSVYPRSLRIITGLIENQALAALVRIFRVDGFCAAAAPIPKVVTCLSLLHNMHTLYLNLYDNPSLFEDAFCNARFPQVRTLVTHACYAGLFVPCCPQVRAVISSARMKGWTALSGLFDESSETLEELDGFMISPDCIKYLTETTHNLKIIKFSDWIDPANLLLFKPLRKLHTIDMSVAEHQYRRRRRNPKPDSVLDAWMAAAKQVLTGNQGQRGQIRGGKRVRMSYRWVDHMNVGENQQPLVRGRFEDVEVD